jgi:hypothetical protein
MHLLEIAMDNGLNDDVLEAVLLWLGPKPVSAVRIVCSRWRDVYDSLHLEVSPRDWLQGLSGLLRSAWEAFIKVLQASSLKCSISDHLSCPLCECVLNRIAPKHLILSYGSEQEPDQESVDIAWSQLCLQLNTSALSKLELHTSTKDLLRLDLALQLARRAGPALETLIVSGAPLTHRYGVSDTAPIRWQVAGGPG